jgi:hypothetical protein
VSVISLEPCTLRHVVDARRVSLLVDKRGMVLSASESPASLFGFEPQALVGGGYWGTGAATVSTGVGLGAAPQAVGHCSGVLGNSWGMFQLAIPPTTVFRPSP